MPPRSPSAPSARVPASGLARRPSPPPGYCVSHCTPIPCKRQFAPPLRLPPFLPAHFCSFQPPCPSTHRPAEPSPPFPAGSLARCVMHGTLHAWHGPTPPTHHVPIHTRVLSSLPCLPCAPFATRSAARSSNYSWGGGGGGGQPPPGVNPRVNRPSALGPSPTHVPRSPYAFSNGTPPLCLARPSALLLHSYDRVNLAPPASLHVPPPPASALCSVRWHLLLALAPRPPAYPVRPVCFSSGPTSLCYTELQHRQRRIIEGGPPTRPSPQWRRSAAAAARVWYWFGDQIWAMWRLATPGALIPSPELLSSRRLQHSAAPHIETPRDRTRKRSKGPQVGKVLLKCALRLPERRAERWAEEARSSCGVCRGHMAPCAH